MKYRCQIAWIIYLDCIISLIKYKFWISFKSKLTWACYTHVLKWSVICRTIGTHYWLDTFWWKLLNSTVKRKKKNFEKKKCPLLLSTLTCKSANYSGKLFFSNILIGSCGFYSNFHLAISSIDVDKIWARSVRIYSYK